MSKVPGRWVRMLRRHRGAIIGFATTLIVTLLVATLDILGLHGNLQAASDTTATRMLAATDRIDAGQKAISVVLIDPAYMQGANGRAPNWPLPTNDFIGNILDPIVSAGAKAVFIDISFTDMPRALSIGGAPQPDAVAQLGSRIRDESRKTPILVANQLPVSADERDCAPGWVNVDGLASSGTTSQAFIAALAKPDAAGAKPPANVQVVPANWLGPSTEYPVGAMIASPPHSCAAVGDAMRESGAAAAGAGGFLLSPAAALLNSACPGMPAVAQSLCDQFKLLRRPEANRGYALYALPADLTAHMVVRWKTGLSPAMQARIARGQDADKCRAQTSRNKLSGMAAQIFHAFLPSIATAFGGANDDFPCFAIDTLSAAEARASVLEDPSSPAYREFTDLVKDRIVLIGAAMPSVPDKITTSFGVDVPGVFLHAMALDNMIGFGSAYPRRIEGSARLIRDFLEALAVALCGLALPVLVRFLKNRGWFAARSQLSRIAHFLVALLLLSLGIFILAIGFLFLFPFVGSPIFIALGVIIVLTEDLRRLYFSHGEAAYAGTYPAGAMPLQGEGAPAHIFISYSSQDSRSAMALCRGLEERGLACWIAGRDIKPGDNYQDTIVDALSSASAVVLVFSVNANASAEIKKEIALSGQRKLVVVPVRIDKSTPSQGFSYELATRQWIDATGDWDAALDQAADRLRNLAMHPA